MLEHSVSRWKCAGSVKDFHTINNIFESPVWAIERNRLKVLKLFFFAILVQGFEIKVENSRVVSFLLVPLCRGSLCRDIG